MVSIALRMWMLRRRLHQWANLMDQLNGTGADLSAAKAHLRHAIDADAMTYVRLAELRQDLPWWHIL